MRAFGAKGDGKPLDTPAINKAIETAAAAGDGTVDFPAGTYLSVSIRLRSNITLQLNHGATILAAEPVAGTRGALSTYGWEQARSINHDRAVETRFWQAVQLSLGGN